MKPPAPRPVSGLSVANEVRTAATAASTAFPPSRSTLAPASAVSGWPAATAPRAVIGNRSVTGHEFRHVDAEVARARLETSRGPRAAILRAPHRGGRGARGSELDARG